jgi:hypothetical protein
MDVHAALAQPWSNGQTEGEITNLELIKLDFFRTALCPKPASSCAESGEEPILDADLSSSSVRA